MSNLSNIIKGEIKYHYIKNLVFSEQEKFLEKEYRLRTGKKLDLRSPKTYTEKMQYAKLYENSSLKTELTDKFKVRNWVSTKIGEKYLIPLLGVWDDFQEINFDTLPNKFVLKTNHGSGWNLLVKNKSDINFFKERLKFGIWMKKNFAYYGDLQLHYREIEPKLWRKNLLKTLTVN